MKEKSIFKVIKARKMLFNAFNDTVLSESM